MSKQFIVEMNDTEYCAIKATPEKYKTLAHKILERGTLVKTGHWMAIDEEPHEDYECDKCGYVVSTYTANIEPHTEYRFCPNCGAKMEEQKPN